MRCLNKFFGLEHNRQPIIPSESQKRSGPAHRFGSFPRGFINLSVTPPAPLSSGAIFIELTENIAREHTCFTRKSCRAPASSSESTFLRASIDTSKEWFCEGEQDEKADDHFICRGPADVRSRCGSIRGAAAGLSRSCASLPRPPAAAVMYAGVMSVEPIPILGLPVRPRAT
jgi:hypothetical protein